MRGVTPSKKSGSAVTMNPLALDAKVFRDGLELVDQPAVARVKADEQRAGFDDFERSPVTSFKTLRLSSRHSR